LVTKGSVLVASPGGAREGAYPKRILVPLDGSLRTESVLPVAARLAGSEGAEVILAHVVVEPSPNGVLSAKSDVELAKELTNRLESGAERYLEHLRTHVLRDVGAVKTLVARSPDEGRCLLDIIERQAVDFVVLSAHGASCDPARTFGSVTAQLLWHSRVPLLVLQDLHDFAVDAAVESGGRGAPALRAQFAEDAT
jgi:nucleotide-binding universal stress UspA family protein